MKKIIITITVILFSVNSFAQRKVAQEDIYSTVERSILFVNQDQAIEIKKMQTGELFSFARLKDESGDLRSFVLLCSDFELEGNKRYICAMSGNGKITFSLNSNFESLTLQPYSLRWNQYDSPDNPGLSTNVKSEISLEFLRSE